jgi:hypothetical protein
MASVGPIAFGFGVGGMGDLQPRISQMPWMEIL